MPNVNVAKRWQQYAKERVRVYVEDKGYGTLMFYDYTRKSPHERKCGVALDEPNGKHGGLGYFHCDDPHGVIVSFSDTRLLDTKESAQQATRAMNMRMSLAASNPPAACTNGVRRTTNKKFAHVQSRVDSTSPTGPSSRGGSVKRAPANTTSARYPEPASSHGAPEILTREQHEAEIARLKEMHARELRRVSTSPRAERAAGADSTAPSQASRSGSVRRPRRLQAKPGSKNPTPVRAVGVHAPKRIDSFETEAVGDESGRRPSIVIDDHSDGEAPRQAWTDVDSSQLQATSQPQPTPVRKVAAKRSPEEDAAMAEARRASAAILAEMAGEVDSAPTSKSSPARTAVNARVSESESEAEVAKRLAEMERSIAAKEAEAANRIAAAERASQARLEAAEKTIAAKLEEIEKAAARAAEAAALAEKRASTAATKLENTPSVTPTKATPTKTVASQPKSTPPEQSAVAKAMARNKKKQTRTIQESPERVLSPEEDEEARRNKLLAKLDRLEQQTVDAAWDDWSKDNHGDQNSPEWLAEKAIVIQEFETEVREKMLAEFKSVAESPAAQRRMTAQRSSSFHDQSSKSDSTVQKQLRSIPKPAQPGKPVDKAVVADEPAVTPTKTAPPVKPKSVSKDAPKTAPPVKARPSTTDKTAAESPQPTSTPEASQVPKKKIPVIPKRKPPPTVARRSSASGASTPSGGSGATTPSQGSPSTARKTAPAVLRKPTSSPTPKKEAPPPTHPRVKSESNIPVERATTWDPEGGSVAKECESHKSISRGAVSQRAAMFSGADEKPLLPGALPGTKKIDPSVLFAKSGSRPASPRSSLTPDDMIKPIAMSTAASGVVLSDDEDDDAEGKASETATLVVEKKSSPQATPAVPSSDSQPSKPPQEMASTETPKGAETPKGEGKLENPFATNEKKESSTDNNSTESKTTADLPNPFGSTDTTKKVEDPPNPFADAGDKTAPPASGESTSKSEDANPFGGATKADDVTKVEDANPFGGTNKSEEPKPEPKTEDANPFGSSEPPKSNDANPFGEASKADEKPKTGDANPFGGASEAPKKDDANPFGSTDPPKPDDANPFAAPSNADDKSKAAEANPFASSDAPKTDDANPFGGAPKATDPPKADEANPFGGASASDAANPFGGDPKSDNANPFGSTPQADKPADADQANPFGASPAKAEEANPFSGAPAADTANPFGGGSKGDDANPFGGSSKPEDANPFGAASTKPTDSANPFGGSAPASGSTVDVALVQQPGEKLGFSVRETDRAGTKVVVISKITPGQVADKSGKLQVGQVVEKINGVAIVAEEKSGATKQKAVDKIKEKPANGGPLVLTVSVDPLAGYVAKESKSDKSGADAANPFGGQAENANPFGGAPEKTEPAAANPFGSPPADDSNPFGGGATDMPSPVKPLEDKLAAARARRASEKAAKASSTTASPSQATSSTPSDAANPFGAPQPTANDAANPFGGPAAAPVANPFGGDAANPFGGSPKADANPFGAPAAAQNAPNPFGAPANDANPFGAPKDPANPFA